MHEAQIIWSLIAVTLTGFFLFLSFSLFRLKKRLSAKENELAQLATNNQNIHNELDDYKHKFNQVVLHDAVSGLPSFEVFKNQMRYVLEQNAAHQVIFGLLFLDIRNFRIINNTLGYSVGDSVLKEVGNRLQSCIRQMDCVCRFSGDVFVILLSKLNHPDSAMLVVHRFFQKLADTFYVGEHGLSLQANIGIATYPADGSDVETLLKKAAHALSQAKVSSSQSFQFYQEAMQGQGQRELILNSMLSSEALTKAFSIEYLPEMDLETHKNFGWEAMLRWDHPELGLISMNELAQLAERNGKIEVINEWVLEHVCRQMQTWQAQGYILPPISINISPRFLESPHFVSILLRILQETQVDARSLFLEIAESEIFHPNENTDKAFSVLKQLGITVAIDHFGAGDFLLRRLKTLPIDRIKIDSNFIRDITTSKESEAIVNMILVLANTLDKDVVALGVETEAQKQLLQKLGCRFMQGSLFGDPIKEAELEQKFSTQAAKSVHHDELTVS